MRNYSTEVKRTVIEKLLRPDGPTVPELSREMDIPKETLYTWIQKAKNGTMSQTGKRRPRFSLQEKQRLILEARSLKDEDLGHWLREKGLHESQLIAWAEEINLNLEYTDGRGGRESELRRKIKDLEKELNRKDKALAEMTALVVLKKKLAELMGEEDPQI